MCVLIGNVHNPQHSLHDARLAILHPSQATSLHAEADRLTDCKFAGRDALGLLSLPL